MEFKKSDEVLLVVAVLKHLDHIESMVRRAMICLTEMRSTAVTPEFLKHYKNISDIILSSEGFYFFDSEENFSQEDLDLHFQQALSSEAELLYQQTLSLEAELLYQQAITVILEGRHEQCIDSWVSYGPPEDGITLTVLLLAARRYCGAIVSEFTLPATLLSGGMTDLTKSYLKSYKEKNVPSLKNKLTEILRISQVVSELHVFISELFRDVPKEAANRERLNKSHKKQEEKKKKQWENIRNAIRDNFNAIYSPGYSLHKVAKNIEREMGKHMQKTPDLQTIKRHLEEFANITSTNLNQISHLFNKGDWC